MPKGGTLTIETAQVELTRSPVYHLTPLPPGPYVRLAVSDTGCGMDRMTQSHIFEPFFTTKGEGKGSGLGLSTVFGIVTQSGGAIDVTSRVGHGTRFDLYFPSVESDIITTAPTQPLGQPQRGTETILLVEDEPSVRTLVRDELRKLGYRVVEAKNGVEACLLATQQAASLQLLLTDVVMPGMGGRELAQHLPSSSRTYEPCSYRGIWMTLALWPDKKRARAVSYKSPSLLRCSAAQSAICSMPARHQTGPAPPHRQPSQTLADYAWFASQPLPFFLE